MLKNQVSLSELKQRLLLRIRQADASAARNIIDLVIVQEKASANSNWRIGDFISVGHRPISKIFKNNAFAAQAELQRECDIDWSLISRH
jgi:hypothetical protein